MKHGLMAVVMVSACMCLAPATASGENVIEPKAGEDIVLYDGDVLRLFDHNVAKWELYMYEDRQGAETGEATVDTVLQFRIENYGFPMKYDIPIAPSVREEGNGTTYEYFRWKKYHRFFEGDDVLFNGFLVKVYMDEKTDTIPMSLIVLPSIPRILSASFECLYLEEYDELSYGKADFMVKATRLGRGIFPNRYNREGELESELRVHYWWPQHYGDTIFMEQIQTDDWQFDDYGIMHSRNFYGEVLGTDTFFVNDYIDEEVMEKHRQHTVGIENATNAPAIQINAGADRIIRIEGGTAAHWHADITSADGRTVFTGNDTKRIDASQWPQGIYIIKIRDEKNKSIIKKIRL